MSSAWNLDPICHLTLCSGINSDFSETFNKLVIFLLECLCGHKASFNSVVWFSMFHTLNILSCPSVMDTKLIPVDEVTVLFVRSFSHSIKTSWKPSSSLTMTTSAFNVVADRCIVKYIASPICGREQNYQLRFLKCLLLYYSFFIHILILRILPQFWRFLKSH